METGARTAPAKNRFDQADRDRIRRALLRYMREHAIGVPTLQKEIAAANALSLDRVPLKTLQRFLGNTHRSNEAMVRFCDRFIGNAAGPDPIADLGEQVAAFLGVWRSGHQVRPVPPDLMGVFAGRAEAARAASGSIRVYRSSAEDWVAFSRIEIESLASRPFAAVRETVTNWNRRPVPTGLHGAAETEPRRAYEGIAIHPNDCLFVLLRNVLTGAPRLYWLRRFADHPFAGHGHEAAGALDDDAAPEGQVYSTARVIFDRTEG